MKEVNLEQFYKKIREFGKLGADLIGYLEYIFPEQKHKILEVLARSVTKNTYLPSNRILWIINGENQRQYLVYPKIFK